MFHNRFRFRALLPLTHTLKAYTQGITYNAGPCLYHTPGLADPASLLQTLPELVTPLKGHSLSARICPPTLPAPSERFGRLKKLWKLLAYLQQWWWGKGVGGGHGLSALSTRRGGWLSVFSAYRGEGRRLSALFTFREGGWGGGKDFQLCLHTGVGATAFIFV